MGQLARIVDPEIEAAIWRALGYMASVPARFRCRYHSVAVGELVDDHVQPAS